MKLCWLIPSDKSGGISPVAISCCRQAVKAGYEATMLMLHAPSWLSDQTFKVSSLELPASAPETPKVLLQWLEENPQDIVLINDCREFDPIIPHLPSTIKCVYVVHDTAPRYWANALQEEDNLEAIVAVSETVASKFRHQLKDAQKLSVISNGCLFPTQPETSLKRQNDLIFLGGDNPTKGAFDVLNLWKQLVKLDFSGKLHWFGNVKPVFRTQIANLPNSQHIQIYGHVHRDLIFSTAASAKVLLMLSRVEPFGMATIEAMSMGCVPVAWDIETGTKEIAIANKSGLFAPLNNTYALAKQILYACESHQVLSSAAIERARTAFNETVMWNHYASMIDRISNVEPIQRPKMDQIPIPFSPPIHRFQLLPSHLRSTIREFVGRSPILGYWLRDMRGL